jgi:diguanylate cyclase (GGDEF)-like protein
VQGLRLRGQLRRLPIALGLLLAAGALAVALATTPDHRSQHVLAANAAMQAQLLRQAVIVESRAPADLAGFQRITHAFDDALSEGLAATRPGSAERALLRAQGALADRWRLAATQALLAPADGDTRGAAQRNRLLDRFGAQNAALQRRVLDRQEARDRGRHRFVLAAAIAFAALMAAAGAVAAMRGWRRHAARVIEDKSHLLEDRRHRAAQEEFGRALQGTRTQREAQRMLKRYLERGFRGSRATVLDRDNADNRLEAVTGLPTDSPLAVTLDEAAPDDCLAVRFGRLHHRAADGDPLLPCKLCSPLDCAVTCVPSLVGGEVIGSVLVETPCALDEEGQRRLEDAVAHAAPVLASMRNLRLAETRAATDTLTGLANRRAAEETLRLMVASADRTTSCCAVALFDLDHFKHVNDAYGHETGDHLLAAVGKVSRSSIRASDFVARFGGEEFLLVLSNTDVEGAMIVCDKLRHAIASLRVAGMPEKATASFGIAAFPGDGATPEELLRGADRALYAAKSAGRNCVRALRALESVDEPRILREPSRTPTRQDA